MDRIDQSYSLRSSLHLSLHRPSPPPFAKRRACRMEMERHRASRRTPATASASGVRSEENVPPGGVLDTAPSTSAAASRTPLRAIQPLAGTPEKGSGVKEAACKGTKPATGERYAEVRRPKVRDAILFWEENRNRNVQNVSSARQQDECSDTEGSIFSIQLKRTQTKLKKALKLNARYRQELASRTFIERDKDETQTEVEYELAKVITSLTEEVASLRQELVTKEKNTTFHY